MSAPPSGRLPDGTIFDLLTPEQYANLPDGVSVISISGEVKVKGTDYIDGDTRAGYLAYGLITTIRRKAPSIAQEEKG